MHKTMDNMTTKCRSSEITDGYVLLNLARNWLKQGNTVVAGELLASAIRSPQASDDPELRANLLKETGRVGMMESDWMRALHHYTEAEHVFLQIDNKKGAAECARNRANMHFQKGEYSNADNLCRQALEWTADLEDSELRATILNTMAAVKSAIGEYKHSISLFRLCLSDFRSANNTTRQGHVLLNIGLTLTKLGEFDQAIVDLTEALNIALEVQDLQLVEICYQNIARNHLEQGDALLARSILDTARRILKALNNPSLECELDLIDCRVKRKLGDNSGAASLLEEARGKAISHGLSALEADFLFEEGALARADGNIERATSKLQSALSQYDSLGIIEGSMKARKALKALGRRACA